MEALLRNAFTVHYGYPISLLINSEQTNATYFELKDDSNLIYTSRGGGIAKYNNANSLTVTVINYEIFIDSFPPIFRISREKCDLIVYTNNARYFLLNELTDTYYEFVNPYRNLPGKRNKAISQLLNSLKDLIQVPQILSFISSFNEKRCCFFNKKPNSPLGITAVTAFNRVNTISQNGLKMSNPDIENYGFDLYEYSAEQSLTLQ